MPKFDTRPTVVDIDHYAGDTLNIRVNIASDVVAGRQWKAQVRHKRTDATAAANFLILEDSTGAFVQLLSEDCQRLAAEGIYKGYWDVQLAEAGGLDPVTTLAGGDLKIYPDVTRTP